MFQFQEISCDYKGKGILSKVRDLNFFYSPSE